MKGNVGKHGKSFKNRVKYILKDDHDFICSNMSSDKDNINELTSEFRGVSEFRHEINKPVIHAFLSLPKGDNLSSEKWEEIAKDYLKEMNIDTDKHQYICVRHRDTDKDHIHIVANRVGLDGSIWYGKHDALKTISACERLEVKHNLTITQGLKGSKSDVSMPTKAEIEMSLRTGEKPARLVLQASLQVAMARKPDLETFVERLQAVGIEPRFNVASTGNVAGCSFSVNDVAFKAHLLVKNSVGTQLNRRLNMTKIEMMNSLEACQQEKQMTKIILDDHLLNQISMTVEPLTESMMILSESVSIALSQTQQTLTRVNNSLETTTTALNSAKNTIDQQAKNLEDQNKKLYRYSVDLKNSAVKSQTALIIKVALIVGVINLIAVILVGYLIMQKQLQQPPISLDAKAVATSIVEQLRSKR